MDWLQYVIPLIVVVVYVISHVVSAYQEQQRQQEAELRKRPAPTAPAASSDEESEGRRLDLDRRTEEARGRREELARDEEARPRAEEAPVSRYDSEDEVAARVPHPATKVHWHAPKPVAMPVIPPVPTPAPPVVIPVAAVVAGRPTSPVARQVVAFLRDRNSLAAALLLKEVLDPPLSRRPRRS